MRLKILYLVDYLPDTERSGGTERQILQLIAHLDRERVDPHLALFRPTPQGERVFPLPCPAELLGIWTLAAPAGIGRLVKLARSIRRRGFDVVHIFMNDAAIAGPPACRLGGAKVIVSRRDMGFWYTPKTLAALRVANLFVDRVVANSEAVKANVHVRERFPLARTDVLYNGHDPARFEAAPLADFRERHGIGPDDPIVGIVANFNPWKRHTDLIGAFARVRQDHPRAHLVLVGSGPLRHQLEAEAATRELADVVHFQTGIDEVIPIVKHFAIGVLCSKSEGFSNAIIEYMGCGVPTVCTNVGGNAELIVEGITGHLVAPGDITALAERISTLLANRRQASTIGEQARSAASRLTIQRMAELHMDLYERLAG